MAGELILDSVVARHATTASDGARAINAPSAVEQHFIEATAKVKKIAERKPAKGKGGAQ